MQHPKPDNRIYLRNAYGVLLTRARQGMVIFVPQGSSTDPTRSPAFYDSTFKYLTEIGIPEGTGTCQSMIMYTPARVTARV